MMGFPTIPRNAAFVRSESVNFAVIVAKHLFIAISLQMQRLNTDIRAFYRPLEQTPEIVQSVRVNATAHVSNRVIDEIVLTSVYRDVRYDFSASL